MSIDQVGSNNKDEGKKHLFEKKNSHWSASSLAWLSGWLKLSSTEDFPLETIHCPTLAVRHISSVEVPTTTPTLENGISECELNYQKSTIILTKKFGCFLDSVLTFLFQTLLIFLLQYVHQLPVELFNSIERFVYSGEYLAKHLLQTTHRVLSFASGRVPLNLRALCCTRERPRLARIQTSCSSLSLSLSLSVRNFLLKNLTGPPM